MEFIEFQLHECYKFIRSNFKCERCGRCCVCINPIEITQIEAQEISKKEKKPVSEFVNGLSIKKEKYEPCPFLEGKDCSIYDLRPASCKTYPFLQITKRSKEYSSKYHKVQMKEILREYSGILVLVAFEDIECTKRLENMQLREHQ